jgi:hypothetical protein
VSPLEPSFHGIDVSVNLTSQFSTVLSLPGTGRFADATTGSLEASNLNDHSGEVSRRGTFAISPKHREEQTTVTWLIVPAVPLLPTSLSALSTQHEFYLNKRVGHRGRDDRRRLSLGLWVSYRLSNIVRAGEARRTQFLRQSNGGAQELHNGQALDARRVLQTHARFDCDVSSLGQSERRYLPQRMTDRSPDRQ